MSAIVEGRRGLVGGDVGFCGGAWNVDRMEGRGDVGGAPAVVEVELRSEDLGERGVGVMCGMTANRLVAGRYFLFKVAGMLFSVCCSVTRRVVR